MLACACPQEEPDQLTDLFAEKISSIEFQQLIFCTDGQFQLPGGKNHSLEIENYSLLLQQ